MPLTRNLYESDEVVAALQLSLRTGDKNTALFWAHELVASDELPLTLQILRAAWLRWGAPHDHYVLTLDFSPSLVYRIAAACSSTLTSSTQPLTMLNDATTISSPPPGNILAVTKRQQEARHLRAGAFAKSAAETGEIDTPTAKQWWLSLEGAIRTSSPAAAMWFLQWAQPVICADTIWMAITSMTTVHRSIVTSLRSAASAHSVCQLLYQAAAVLFLTRYAQELPPPVMAVEAEVEANAHWAALSATTGRRAGRRLAIPPEALHTGTTRGSLSAAYTNIDDCRNPLTLLPVACRFWRTAVSQAGMIINPDREEAVFPSDDILEHFYATYFPDDTPDEWSLVDQQKSHGRGCAETAPPDPTIVFVRDTYTEPGFRDAAVEAIAHDMGALLRL